MKHLAFYLITFSLTIGTTQAQWSKVDSIHFGGLYSVEFINADTGYTYNEPGILRRTFDGGQNWDTGQVELTGFMNDIEFYDHMVGYIVGGAWFPVPGYPPFSIMKTSDGGATWDSIFSGGNGGVFQHVEVLSADEFYAISRWFVIHSSDGGSSFDTAYFDSQFPMGAENYSDVQFISSNTGFALANAQQFVPGNVMNLYKTTNGGQSWSSAYKDSVTTRTEPSFVMNSAGKGIIFAWKDKIIRTTDAGNNWQFVPKPDTNVIFYKAEAIGDHLYAFGSDNSDTTANLYYSNDWGTSWQKQFSLKPQTGYMVDFTIPDVHTGYFITYRELYKNSQLISLFENELIIEFDLFPNPASDQLTINHIGSDGINELEIYNSSGILVAKHLLENQTRAEVSVATLPTGMYLCVIKSEDIGYAVQQFIKTDKP